MVVKVCLYINNLIVYKKRKKKMVKFNSLQNRWIGYYKFQIRVMLKTLEDAN